MSDIDIPFTVSFTHRLRTTADVAGNDFAALTSVLDADEGQPAKVQLWVDSNLHDVPACNETASSDSAASDASSPGAFANRLTAQLAKSDLVELAGPMHVIPGGEVCKNSPDVLETLLGLINEHNMDRRSYVIVAGGGAVLDVAGYAAAIAHRGIRLIRLPSTTLAQADSGVGVKNAINYFGKKNWVGTFAVPWAVINDTEILQTLPDRDFRSGLTEAVKVALLKDPKFFAYLQEHADSLRQREPAVSSEAIKRSCRLHIDHITRGGDPFEGLEARPLDFGHWSAHRLEPMTQYALRHGEAVGIGVALDSLYSSRQFGFPESDAMRVIETLAMIGTPLWCDAIRDTDAVLQGLEEFRQHLGGRLTVTMLKRIGESVNVHEIDRTVMRKCIEDLQTIAAQHESVATN
ncbi:3-dehydroquinate synthase [Neorhodopirellula lusitana]|uniref:3-dehydroquinate synthase n=1 Tax=Neorhodopirellula lusitana TaxID=445327 RepID=A0ABY1QKC3_9BACT|nr:3-dehydroquinate synthase [Neorhodopirellula lusitana]SMP74150.1 3-dehydroquinate synthase [Neorhodopirellula lusitana]